MKKFILLLVLSVSLATKSQTFIGGTPTFIGKTQEEITNLNKSYANKLTSGESDSLFTELKFVDSKSTINYTFIFSKNQICSVFMIETQDKSARDSILKDIEKKCQEKLAEKAWLQKLNGKNYIWNIQGNADFYVFSTTQNK